MSGWSGRFWPFLEGSRLAAYGLLDRACRAEPSWVRGVGGMDSLQMLNVRNIAIFQLWVDSGELPPTR